MRIAVTALSLLVSAAPHVAQAQDDAPARLVVGAELDVPSRYVSRGVALSAGAALQPTAWAAVGPLGVSGWASFDPARHAETRGRPTDVAVTAAYDIAFGALTVTPSAAWLTFPGLDDAASSVEIAVDATFGEGALQACAGGVVDAKSAPGAVYATLGGCAGRSLGAGAYVDAALVGTFANAEFGRFNFGAPAAGLTGAEARLALTFDMPRQAYLRAHASVSQLTHPEARRATNEDTLAFAGLAVGAEI